LQEHEDAHEFLHKLQTKVDAYGPNIKPEYKPMSAAMGGVMVHTFTCSTVDFQSCRADPFAPLQICVDVQVRIYLWMLEHAAIPMGYAVARRSLQSTGVCMVALMNPAELAFMLIFGNFIKAMAEVTMQ
jgi:hypothetical protein